MKIFRQYLTLSVFFGFKLITFTSAFGQSAIPNKPQVEWIEILPDSIKPNVIFIDSFEDGQSLNDKYFDYNSSNGDYVVTDTVGFGNSIHSLRSRWVKGQVSAGALMYMFGRNPVKSFKHVSSDFDDIYWRFYIRHSSNWTGNPHKLSRATIFAGSNWSQAMIAHVWGEGGDLKLSLDPASGIDNSGILATTKWNDFSNLRWLGLRKSNSEVFHSSKRLTWQCIEVHVKLNTPGQSDGIFEMWIDGELEAGRNNLDWTSTWSDYGVNAIMLSNYWNGGAPQSQERYLDNLVISSKRIDLASSPLNPIIYKTQFSDPDVGDSQSLFQAQISSSLSETNLVWQGEISNQERQITANSQFGTFEGALTGAVSLNSFNTYFARVRVKDQAGNFSNWSVWKIFKTGINEKTTMPLPPKNIEIH